MNQPSSVNRDFKSRIQPTQTSRSVNHHHLLLMVAGALIGLGVVLGVSPDKAQATRPAALASTNTQSSVHTTDIITTELSPTDTNEAITLSQISDPAQNLQQLGKWHNVSVKKGDNLALIFNRFGVSAKQLHELINSGGDTSSLAMLRPGDDIELYIDQDGLKGLVFDIDEERTLQVSQGSEGYYIANTIYHQLDKRTTHATGIIENSLFLTAQKAGLSDNLTMELAGIFGWDIDFVLDIREGDAFAVIYEEVYQNGEKIRDGDILAAEFINRGNTYRAIRYTDDRGRTGYFAPDGKNMRKTFLRSPVGFTRVSSRFSLGRKHPILNTIRAHKGVDYAAPTGTPVKATGDGRIIHRGRKGGYGKAIIIQHGSKYSTLYAHLSSYARGTQYGKHVKQGQVIGYVGSTGLATGPHLHYEFRLNGVHRNPLTVRFPDAAPLAAQYKDDFINKSTPYIAQLDLVGHTSIALNQP